MYGRVGLRVAGDSYTLTLTPVQFELIRRILVNVHGGSNSTRVLAIIAGEPSTKLLELRDREVDFRSHESVEVTLDHADFRALCGSLMFAFLSRSSEEAFHHRFGFYGENVQTVGWAIFNALQKADVPAD